MAVLAAGAPASDAQEVLRVRLIYTGRSLGAIGVLSDPDEHELLVEQAARASQAVRLEARRGWRAGGATLFSTDADLDAQDLAAFLARPPDGSSRTRGALISNNAILVQLEDGARDLVKMAAGNPRAPVDFPDLHEGSVEVRTGRLPGGAEWTLVLEDDAWPPTPEAWTASLVNGIHVGPDLLFEMAVNLGQMGSRATLLAEARRAAPGTRTIVVDLGERDGDLGLERLDRARLDYGTLSTLGYEIVVPYEFELALGVDGLAASGDQFKGITWLASNVKARGQPSLLRTRHLIDVDGVRIGLIGLVDPELRGVLAKASREGFEFEPPEVAAAREAAALRQAGADAVIALSNLHPRDNNFVAREVAGLDAIVADLHVRWSPEEIETRVQMPDRPRSRPGSPALVARGFANGLGLGTLDLEFRQGIPGARRYLSAMTHHLQSITDRVPPDVGLVRAIRLEAGGTERPRGDILVPAFQDLVRARPALARFDSTATEGRISKRMWEEFLARLIRVRARAELGVLRKLPNFPPVVGALHEAEVRSWLWTEDDIVTLDLSGAELRSILAEDVAGDLVVVGLDRRRGTVNGRRLQDLGLYRIATTDQLLEGARFGGFAGARRVQRRFRVKGDGAIEASRDGDPLPVRSYVLGELDRIRRGATAPAVALSGLLDRDPPFEPLFTFRFDRPTVFASANRSVNTDGYGSVPESRVQASDSQVIGVTGRYVLGYERQKAAWDLGALVAFSRNRVHASGAVITSEPADDVRADLTLRARRGASTQRVQPFVRAALDSEFTASIDPATRLANPHQLLARGIAGLTRTGPRWTLLELGAAVENDLTRGSNEFGIEGAVRFDRRVSATSGLSYRWDNTFNYYFPAKTDDDTDLGMTLRMVHELLIPVVDELSLSVAADIFVFRGKVPPTSRVGASAILRVGLSYDRLWKPRYQPFF